MISWRPLRIVIATMILQGCNSGPAPAGENQPASPAPTFQSTAPETTLCFGVPSVPNLRDLGGYATSDGATVARGLVYRSSQLNPVSADSMERIAQLGLKYDFDLRTEEERKRAPDELPPDVEEVWLNVLADLGPPPDPPPGLGPLDQVIFLFKWVYRNLVTLESAKESYRRLYISLSEQENLPALFHCSAGKDRTGWGAAALVTWLGVPKEQVEEDYLRSNDVLPLFKHYIDTYEGGREAARAIVGVRPEYLATAFEEMEKEYGSIERYFSDGLGIDAATQQALRDRLLTRSTVVTVDTDPRKAPRDFM